MHKLINKTTITIAAFVAILAFAAIQTQRIGRIKKKLEIAESERDLAVKVATDQKADVKFYRNQYNNLVAKSQDTEVVISGLQKLRETERLSFLSRFDGLQRKLKNLERASSIDFEIDKDSVPKSVVVVPCPPSDSIRAWKYELKDEYNDISAIVLDTPRFEVKVPVQTVRYWERKKILGLRIGRKQYWNETTSPNRIVRITDQEFFEMKKIRGSE